MKVYLTGRDRRVVEAFTNFISWGELPYTRPGSNITRKVPPAWYAYALGHTEWCPPKGTL